MTTIEQLEEITVIDGIDDVDPLVAHIYDGLSDTIAKCGAHVATDKHKQMHIDNGVKEIPLPRGHGLTACPVDGTPICPACLKLTRP